MLNGENILGWLNLALRLILSFGLIFIVNFYLGALSVTVWLVYITIIATINSVDGLLSQFYIRDIIASTWQLDNNKKYCTYYNQQVIYLVISMFVSAIVYFTLKIPKPYLYIISCMFSFYMISRTIDARFKAYYDASIVQKIEISLNVLLLLYVLCSMYCSHNIEQFIVLHLSGLLLQLLYKNYSVRKSEGYSRYKSNSCGFVRKFKYDQTMLKTITISFGSGLSINLSLLLLEAMIPGGVESQFLFTYRVASLICEIISIPVIIRIPEITRLISSGDVLKARIVFAKNYKVSIILCVVCMIITICLQNLWNKMLPTKLHLTTIVVLCFILGGWLFERIATLLSQYYLSSRRYDISQYYILYSLFLTTTLVIAIYAKNETIFSAGIFFVNILLAAQIYCDWKSNYAT